MSQVPVKRSRTSSGSPESPGLASPRARRRSNSHLPEDRTLAALAGSPGTAGRHQEGSSASGSGGAGSAGTVSTRGSLAGYGGPTMAPSTLPYSGLPPPPALNPPSAPHGSGSLHRQRQQQIPHAEPSARPSSSQQILPSLHTATGWTSTTNFAMQGGPSDPRGERESSEGSTIGTRDSGRDRQPRSMMACRSPRNGVRSRSRLTKPVSSRRHSLSQAKDEV